MKEFSSLVLRALGIVIVFTSIGAMVNAASQKRLPWIYTPPKEIVLAGVTVPLIDEKEAVRFLHDAESVFVDTRKEADYRKAHVKGSVFMSHRGMEEGFLSVRHLLPDEARLILYCYGPGCHMAERVAEFLAHCGYKKMMIMSAGFHAWKKAGYPVGKFGADDGLSQDTVRHAERTETGND